jgi:hypothetical protein
MTTVRLVGPRNRAAVDHLDTSTGIQVEAQTVGRHLVRRAVL